MVKSLGVLWGILILLGEILSFVPGVTKKGMYFGICTVNSGLRP